MDPIIHKKASVVMHHLPDQSKNLDPTGKWSKHENSELLIPRDQCRETQREEIQLAMKQANLGIRVVSPEEERNYLDQPQKAPRPVCHVQLGASVQIRQSGKYRLGIVNPEMLAVYKTNAGTGELVNNRKAVDQLRVKCLADHHEIKKKMKEQVERRWDVYPVFTSGHLQPDGTYSPPKFKPHLKDLDPGLIPYPEFLTTGYEKSQIKCYCITKADATRNITDILEEKHTLENTLGIGPLPLAVYCQHSGSLEVYFEEELEVSQLADKEACLDDFALSHSIEPQIFRRILNMLPMTLKSESLNKTALEPKPYRKNAINELREMVSNPACYNPEHLDLIKDSGFPLNTHFFFQQQFITIIDLFIKMERERFHNENHETRFLDDIKSTSKRKAELLFHYLANNSAPVIETRSIEICFTPPYLCNYLLAVLAPVDNNYDFWEFMTHPVNFPAIKVEIDRICQRNSNKLDSYLEYALQRPFTHFKNFAFFKHHLLALFYYGAVPDEAILQTTRQEIRKLSTIIANCKQITLGNCSTDDYIKWVQELYRQREQDPFYQSWPAQVEEAKQEIAKLRASLPWQAELLTPLSTEYGDAELQFVMDAFSKPPTLANARDNEETILKILQHYYRRPGPERVLSALGLSSLPTIWKPLHACSHVLRARNNVLWYIELLEKFQLLNCTKDEKTLLALAAIYHDAAAEDVGKDCEEKRSAEYFRRDLAEQYPQGLLDDIALALESKENDVHGRDDDALSATVRGYLRVLRFADRMDIIRCTGVEKNFPGLTDRDRDRSEFNGGMLDLPPESGKFTADPETKSLFQRNLEAAMHGAADLALVTGHLSHDHRPNPYAHIYQLTPEAKQITAQFELTPMPVGKMEDFINNNVRRKIARLAGIHTCSDPDHKTCGTDGQQGITRGIHNSWYDLQQIEVPACMTRLEKMQCEYDDMDVLSEETRQAITAEVQRLKSRGILMNTGTLTQETLRSDGAIRKLQGRGLEVVKNKRLRGYGKDGNPRYEIVLVPTKVQPSNFATILTNQ
ncbi:hypothetical protein [Endozoicomonas sp. SCSIO W0465]|uniref:hypothetical protein n=1 Tax=Endozoicomonas sp. SCSIO W0465 TaxID=2918516 RepID=UPI0020764B94|nr:hypothetical protein [Endozoicomonas sp. SCSIO W0465]USE34338.1 hypothetical protein MJO57_19545 [Endozoicomonas sp. SCSIO W0465]